MNENEEKVIITPSQGGGGPREFVISRDQYGVMIQDIESGVGVILDWNGTEIKALVNSEVNDDPIYIYIYKPNLWAENIDFPRADWRMEVHLENTQLGYLDWVENKKEKN